MLEPWGFKKPLPLGKGSSRNVPDIEIESQVDSSSFVVKTPVLEKPF
jgi:hypothetical protein